jgi:pimeloyl-ACP methyl ester carboxylesterase
LRELIPEKEPTIVGISFGGMLATEIAKADKNCRAILIASSKTTAEIPRYLRAVRFFPLYKWIPANLLRHSSWVVKYITGRNAPRQKKLILDIIRDSDMNFVKWAMTAILHWKNEEVPGNIVHIHGTSDRILPYSRVMADYTIEGGSHVLPLDQSEEISALLKSLIESPVAKI